MSATRVRSSNTLGTRPMSFTTVRVLAVGHRHAGRLLAAVLQGVETQVGEVGDSLAGGEHPEDATGLPGVAVAHGGQSGTATTPFRIHP